MRGTIVRIGVAGAGALLALGLFAAQPAGADPSGGHGVTHGSDTTCFTAGGPQGKSHSDPDGMSNGGADKPGCPGGFDADQDGNNGCGNDADREDDNNGHCGRTGDKEKDVAEPTTSTTTTTTTTTGTVTPDDGTVAPDTEVDDCQIDPKEATGCDDTAGTAAGIRTTGTGTLVSGAAAGTSAPGTTADIAATGAGTDSAPAATAAEPQTQVLGQTLEQGPSALARTGAGVGGMALLGGLLCGSGRLAVLARRFTRIG
jgi:hypothetical protein